MRRVPLFLIAVLAPITALAYAQTADPTTPLDLAAWFRDTAALSAVIIAAVAFLKEHVFKGIQGLTVIVLSLGVGAALGVVGNVTGYIEGSLASGLFFGLSAGLIASGGVDGIRALLKR